MNGIIRYERQGAAFGVDGRFFNVVAADDGRILNQTFSAERYNASGDVCLVRVRFDDESNNGHESFSVTGEWREAAHARRREPDACGCIHDTVAEFFPELAHLFRWHLTSTDGPMHYVSNVVYHAGDRDCWGLRKGERRAIVRRDGRASHTLVALNAPGVSISKNPTGDKYRDAEYLPLFILDKDHAGDDLPPVPVLAWVPDFRVGEGKARDLDAARHCAVWPEATDEELSAEPETLKAALLARLPGLLAAFRADIEGFGFLWPVRQGVQA